MKRPGLSKWNKMLIAFTLKYRIIVFLFLSFKIFFSLRQKQSYNLVGLNYSLASGLFL